MPPLSGSGTKSPALTVVSVLLEVAVGLITRALLKNKALAESVTQFAFLNHGAVG